MCIVSMVQGVWTNPLSPNYPWSGPFPPAPTADNAELAALMRKAIEILERIDKKTGARDCSVQQREKDAYMEQLQKISDAYKNGDVLKDWNKDVIPMVAKLGV